MVREEAAHLAKPRRTFDEALWYFFDWWRKDPNRALIDAVRVDQGGKYPGLASRLLEAIAADAQFVLGLDTTLRRPVKPASMDRPPEQRQSLPPRGRTPARR